MNKPLFIVWQDEYSIGIPILDEQHRGIITTINSLHYFLQQGHELNFLKPTIDISRLFMGFHFATEKELLVQIHYPGIREDTVLHTKLFDQYKETSLEAIEHKDPELLLKFLRQWWISHINEEHKVYAPFLTPHIK
jgi:hemerythrin